MNERERIGFSEKVCFLQKKHWIAGKNGKSQRRRIKSTKLQLNYPLIRQIMTFEEVEEAHERRSFFDGEELRQNEAQDKENLEKSWTDWATEANQASAELDEINVEIQGVKRN